MAKTIFKKTLKYVKGKAKKRYVKKTGGLKIGKMYKDVMTMKKMLNAEKKHLTSDIENALVGQVSGNASGHYIIDVSPVPNQGTGFSNRIGQSIKQVSSYYVFQFQRQVGISAPAAQRIKVQFVYVVGQPYGTVSNALGPFIKANPFVDGGTIYDYHSERRPEYFKDFRVLRTKTIYFPENNQANQVITKTVKIGLKMPENFHVKWQGNTTTQAVGQVFMLITADNGNMAGSVSTLDDIPITAASTGTTFDWYVTHYWYDN